MMKMNLSTKILVSTLTIGGLFLGGTYALQSLSEKIVLAQAEKEITSDTLTSAPEEEDINTDDLTIEEYYNDFLGVSPKITEAFSEKFGDDALNLKMSDMYTDKDKEKFNYINALYHLYQNGNQPILAKNEIKEKNDEGDLEIVLNESGEYSYSLETLLSDVNALSSEIDSTKPIKTICKKHGVDSNGKISDLTPEIIMEIDAALFTISDHPKD